MRAVRGARVGRRSFHAIRLPFFYFRIPSWILVFVLLPGYAWAQHPLCPQPAALDTYYVSCRPNTHLVVARFLYNLSIQHLLKDGDEFPVSLKAFLAMFGVDAMFRSDASAWDALMSASDDLVFRPIDNDVGEFLGGVPTGPQTLTATDETTGVRIEVTVPTRLRGLYWRTPANLDLRFYKGDVVRVRMLGGDNDVQYDAALQCISITDTGTRVVTSDPAHRYLLVGFDRCR
jgi:hypothetical protein